MAKARFAKSDTAYLKFHTITSWWVMFRMWTLHFHPWWPRGSQSGWEKRQDESFQVWARAPGYRLSSNYFQKFKRMPAPDWAKKMLCIIVPNQRTVSPDFFSWVCARRLLSCHTCPVLSPSFCVQGKLLFSTFLTRNKGTTDESKKRLGCYQQEQFNLPREYCFWLITIYRK